MVPKFTTGSAGVSWLTAAAPTPDKVIVAGVPLLPVTVSEPVAGPAEDGAKVTCTLIVWPGMIVLPTTGRPVAVNGAVGGVTEVTVCVVVPKLEIVTTSGRWIPTGTGTTPWSGASGNVCALGCGYSPPCVPSPVRGTSTVGKLADPVLNDSAPLVPPGAAGANVVWAVSLSPWARVTGNVTGTGVLLPFLSSLTWPTVNWLAGAVALEAPVVAVTPVNVTVFVAVMETGVLVVELTGVWAKVAVAAWAGAAAPGAANASRCPS